MARTTDAATRRSTDVPVLRLHLLGGFRASRDAGAQPSEHWTRPSARTLVKLLAVAADHQLHRDEVLAICWPDADRESATRSLGVALHAARRALEPELASRQPSAYLATDGALLRLDASSVWIDADEAERAAMAALEAGGADALAQALGRFTGELLPEDRYAIWTEPRRDRLASLRERVRLALADTRLGAGDPEDAIAIARGVLAEHPADERAHRTIMRASLALGLRRQAIHQYHACRAILDEELGIRPGAETERLHLEALDLTSGSLRPTDTIQPPTQLQLAPPTPLRGREHQLETLSAPGPVVRVVTGEAGLGKTRLITEAARQALDDGAIVLWGSGHDTEGQVPYGAVLEAIDGWLAQRPAVERARVGSEYPELAGVLASLGDTSPETPRSPEEERQRLFRAIAALLDDLAASAPVLVVLEDLHDADLGSFRLIGHLSRRARVADWRMLASLRDDELPGRDPRREVLDALLHDRTAEVIALDRLGREDCLAIAADVLGSDAPERVWELSLGHPLFTLELSREVDDSGGSPPLAEGVRVLLARRLSRLDSAAQRIVEILAVAGGEASMAEIMDVAAGTLHPPLSPGAAASAVDAAVEGAVLAERDVVVDGRTVPGLVFGHPLMRPTTYDRVSSARRQLLHAGYAEVLLRRRPHAVDALAAHLSQADDPRATAYLRQAAERAAALSANETADHYYAELIDRLDAVRAEAAWARIDRSAVLQRTGRFDEARVILTQAISDLRQRDENDGVVLATGRLAEALVSAGAPAEALRILDATPPGVDTDAFSANAHYTARSRVLILIGRYADADRAAARARTFAERVGGPRRRGLLARALQYQAVALALDGRFAQAGPVAEEALPHAMAFGDPQILASVLSVQREQARRAGRLREALGAGRRALELAEQSGNPVGIVFEQANLAELHLLLEEDAEAAGLAAAAVAGSRDGADLAAPYALIALARVRTSRAVDPTDLLDEARRLAVDGGDRQAQDEERTSRAEWLISSGDGDAALLALAGMASTTALTAMSRAQLVAGRWAVAIELATAAVERAAAAGERITEVDARTVRAAALARSGRRSDAAAEFAAADALTVRLDYPVGRTRLVRERTAVDA